MKPTRASLTCSNRIARAEEMAAVDQPNSRCSGSSHTPGAPTAPAVTNIVRKVLSLRRRLAGGMIATRALDYKAMTIKVSHAEGVERGEVNVRRAGA